MKSDVLTQMGSPFQTNILANYVDITFLLSVHLELVSLLGLEPGNNSLAPDSSHTSIKKIVSLIPTAREITKMN